MGSLAPDRRGGCLDVSRVPPKDALRFLDPGRCAVCHEEEARAFKRSAHKRRMLDETIGDSLRCGTCQQAARFEGIGKIAHLRGQTEREDPRKCAFFAGSGASGRLPMERGPLRCIDCHLAPSRGGHAFASANTALAATREADLTHVHVLVEVQP